MDQTLMLNRLAISRWAVEYFNAIRRGSDSLGLGITDTPSRSLSSNEAALYNSALELLNRFLAGEFDWTVPQPPEPMPFPPMPESMRKWLEAGSDSTSCCQNPPTEPPPGIQREN